MLLITTGLTTTSLLLVRRSVESNFRRQIAVNLRNSVNTFENFQQERELMLTRSAELLADLPITRAIMTSPDPVTIQDASRDVWQIARSDLFVLVDRSGKVVALHTRTAGFTREDADKYFHQSLSEEDNSHWWYGDHHLYQVFVQPVYFGSKVDGHLFGFLVIGYEIDNRLAQDVAKVAASQVAFTYGNEVVSTTLSQTQTQSRGLQDLLTATGQTEPRDIDVGNEHFLGTSLEVSTRQAVPVRLCVLGSYDQAAKALNQINRLLLLLGLAAVLIGSGLAFFVSYTFTRPLASLVDGVRALAHGDFHHPLDSRGGDEVAELTRVFERMRTSLLKSQRELLEAEQLATIGRMASSISHDLRHSLAAIVANSEFLCDSHLTPVQREELYQEVRTGVNLMTDLIDSLLEFARTRESLSPAYSNACDAVQRSVQAVRLHPRHHDSSIEVRCNGVCSGWFDSRKLERALYNLLLNACEASPASGGRVGVAVSEKAGAITIEVSDNGPGVADSIRDKLFQPFVSFGKENGTGLGLAVVKKVVQDHRGEIFVERTLNARTVFRIVLPGRAREIGGGASPSREPSFVPTKRGGDDADSISASGNSGQ
jgi:signal transduction histidine kinase